MRRLLPFAVLLTLCTLSAAQAPSRPAASTPVVVHEWGTFTSIAGADGQALQWSAPFPGEDLPCFVDKLKIGNVKYFLPAKMRMETPVVYFYAPARTSVDVKVGFRQGLMTEWFPRADVVPAVLGATNLTTPGFTGTIGWKRVTIDPAASTRFTREPEPNHYYAARETDAAPIEITGQRDRFLFYRGTTMSAPPLNAVVRPDGSVAVENAGGEPVGDVILFENRGGSIAYEVRHAATNRVVLSALVSDGESAAPLAELESLLVAHGLYEREAKAMIATWRDTWFEEGARLFYITSRKFVDDLLPIEISPKPASLARVFVGRIELVTPRTLADVRHALDTRNDTLLHAQERFLTPIVARLKEAAPADEAAISKLFSAYYSRKGPTAAKFCE